MRGLRTVILLTSLLAASLPAAAQPVRCDLLEETRIQGTMPGVWFGRAVAISGNTAVVAAPVPGGGFAFENNSGTWTETAHFDDLITYSVAVSGDRIVLGTASSVAPARVYRREGAAWVLEQVLDDDPDHNVDHFGSAVAIDGHLIVAGVPGSVSMDEPGRAYIFRRVNDHWSLEQTLIGPDGDGARFGCAVAVSNGVVVVGARNAGHSNAAFENGRGAVHWFERVDGEWRAHARIDSPGALPGELERFGRAVAIDNDVMVVGTEPVTTSNPVDPRGAAYVFRRNADQWLSEGRLSPVDIAGGDRFGFSVAISGDTIVAGAWGAALGPTCPFPQTCDDGAAYVFGTDPDGFWIERSRLRSSDLGLGHKFGWSVDVDGSTAMVGAYAANNTPTGPTGAVYFFDAAPCCGSADFNNDGDTGTDQDIEAFFACLGGDCCPTCGSADFDGDGDTGTDADIEAFFRVLGGGAC